MASPRNIADFEVIFTTDGSPSLRIADATGYVEKMHHSEGALSESLYIYGDALEEALKRHWPVRVLSLGLGLGYNELITAAKAVAYGISPDAAEIYSFEIEPVLSQNFSNWVRSRKSDFSKLYDQILHPLATTLHINEKEIKSWLAEALEKNTWHLGSGFPEHAAQVKNVSCVFYDAFSNKMSPELWSEEILKETLKNMCAENCVFSTYASTGALKRALKASGFQKIERRGFAGKRESTFAMRESK